MGQKRRTVSVVLEDSTRRKVKLICARRGWFLREFWEEALRRAITRLEASEEANTEFELRDVPDVAEQTSIWVDRALVAEIDARKRPGVFKRALYYTAIHDHLEHMENDNG